MKFWIRGTLAIFLLTAFKTDNKIIVDRQEARNAFVALQDVRNHPDKYFREMAFDKGLKTSSRQLRWNDTLAKVAENKAYDMANRNYFGHVDPDGFGMNYYINKSGYKLNAEWKATKDDNSFESIAANAFTGKEVIHDLVKDSLTPSLGHRKHLLGLGKWASSLTDIGIGFIRRDSGSLYETYICIIIAKHDW